MSHHPVIIGVDPGERWVGIAARRGPDLLTHAHVDRGSQAKRTRAHRELDGWLATIVDHLEEVLHTVSVLPVLAGAVHLVAVELTTPPTGFRDGKRAPIDPGPLMDTAQVGGAAHAWGSANGIPAKFVTPSRHGTVDLPAGTPAKVARAALEQSYPAELIGARETSGRGKGDLQHVRAAWDVAGAGAVLLRGRQTA